MFVLANLDYKTDLAYLHRVAHEVVDASRVAPGTSISNGGKNTTGHVLRVPGGTRSFYPAFWIRDAAMMLGADLVPTAEVWGWIRAVAATQPGPAGLEFAHGLTVPPYSIPDHITLQGAACWYPGAYTNQGDGAYGFLPPADDAFYFIQMVYECCRRPKSGVGFDDQIATGWGDHALSEVCDRAFESVAVDPKTGLVVCDDAPGRTRVDWGFCDSVRKSGSCLMPSLLRWQAACRLEALNAAATHPTKAAQYRRVAETIAKSVPAVFYVAQTGGDGLLLSATGLGAQDDVWASAFAVWLGVLPEKTQASVARHLLKLYRDGWTVRQGQVRSLPKSGPLGGYWRQTSSARDTYQNGGYWATPTGWLVAALSKVDQKAATALLHEYAAFVRANRASGAPFEWVNPDTHTQSNANYASSAGLVYAAIAK